MAYLNTFFVSRPQLVGLEPSVSNLKTTNSESRAHVGRFSPYQTIKRPDRDQGVGNEARVGLRSQRRYGISGNKPRRDGCP